MRMRFGVIGAGKIGKLRIATIEAHPSLDLVAVYDQSREAVEKAVAGTQARPCTDLQQFLDSGLDAVVVATPAHVHRELCVAAFAAGLHVLCEKPLSNSVEGAAENRRGRPESGPHSRGRFQSALLPDDKIRAEGR